MSGRILFEAHTHTQEGSACSHLPGAQLVALLAEAGYGGCVTTDHYLPGERRDASQREAFLAGYRAAKEAGDAIGFVVLPGIEIRFVDHAEDFLVYGMEEEEILSLPDNACEAGLGAFYELAEAKGWRIYQAHPFRPGHLPGHTAFLHGMETFNGNPRHDSQNRMAVKFSTLHTLHTIGGSDVHEPGDVGIVGLLVPRAALTPKGLAAWLAATPHPILQHQDTPVDGIRYVIGAVPGWEMLAALYRDAGWTQYTAAKQETLLGIERSSRFVTAWDDTTPVGLARIIGDGVTVALVQDLLVLGTYQRRGIGRELLRRALMPYKDAWQTIIVCDDTTQTRLFCAKCGFENIDQYRCAGYIRLR